jgi:hypothetical protein
MAGYASPAYALAADAMPISAQEVGLRSRQANGYDPIVRAGQELAVGITQRCFFQQLPFNADARKR